MTASTAVSIERTVVLRAWIEYAPNADLHSLRMPTLVIYGAQDLLTPVQASVHRIAQLAPTVRSQVFLGADHRLCINDTLCPGLLGRRHRLCTSPSRLADRLARSAPSPQLQHGPAAELEGSRRDHAGRGRDPSGARPGGRLAVGAGTRASPNGPRDRCALSGPSSRGRAADRRGRPQVPHVIAVLWRRCRAEPAEWTPVAQSGKFAPDSQAKADAPDAYLYDLCTRWRDGRPLGWRRSQHGRGRRARRCAEAAAAAQAGGPRSC